MKELEQYKGRKLTTDEIAHVRTEIAKIIKDAEDFQYDTGPDHLLFKFGTLKSWELTSDKGKELLQKYFALGSSGATMTQHDTPEQKELICQMIDECDGGIQSDWTGEFFTKEEAKEYIKEYGKQDKTHG